MKNLILAFICFTLFYNNDLMAQPPAGTLDKTFGGTGIVIKSLGTYSDAAVSAIIQPSDGKILICGYSDTDVGANVMVARFNLDGTLDKTFNGTGKIITPVMVSNDDLANAIDVQSDGKIVVGGYAYNATGQFDFLALRYTTSGALDNTFNGKGYNTISFGLATSTRLSAIAIRPDGKIILGGIVDSIKNYFAFARLKTDGTLDPTFHSDGKFTLPISHPGTEMGKIVLQSDGKIVAAGHGSASAILVRLKPDGNLDSSFGVKGTSMIKLGTSLTEIFGLAMQADGKFVVAGDITASSKYSAMVARYKSNGTLDSTFGTNGVYSTNYGASTYDMFQSIAIQSDGKIVSCGFTFPGNYADMALLRLNSNGSVDTSFSSDGKVVTSVSGDDDFANCILIQKDGKILAVGYDFNGFFYDVSLVRYLPVFTLGKIDLHQMNGQAFVYPNAIQKSATLRYELFNETLLGIKLFDMQGKEISVLLKAELQNAGVHEIPVILPDDLAQGNYVVVLESNSDRIAIKIQK
ncbi:MAG: T9SS type A sorting domain-containing protein [Bacteroidetes bacterium]|nr:T9SS type A sorting domain-containing protein [Bacteroidota bacterium]